MKAIIQKAYGTTSQLEMQDLPVPEAKKRQVLVKVCASAINDYDWVMLEGRPLIYRLMFGLLKPTNPVPGMEFSGVVKACGPDASFFKPGDAVYGDISDYGFGTYKEFVCVDERALVSKPDKLSFLQAAATPHACMLAVQALRDKAGLRENQRVLVNGAGGGVGAFAVALARMHHCHCTGVDSKEKAPHLLKLGFQKTLDYQKEDFTGCGETFDIIIDTKTNRMPWTYLKALKAGGCYCSVGGRLRNLLALVLTGPLLRLLTGKSLKILALKPNQGLCELSDLLNTGQLFCPVDGPFPLAQAPQALQRFGEGRHLGKVVLKIASPEETPQA